MNSGCMVINSDVCGDWNMNLIFPYICPERLGNFNEFHLFQLTFTHMFQRGRVQPPTSYIQYNIYIYVHISLSTIINHIEPSLTIDKP